MNSHHAIRVHWFVLLLTGLLTLSLASCGPTATPTSLPSTSTPIPTLVPAAVPPTTVPTNTPTSAPTATPPPTATRTAIPTATPTPVTLKGMADDVTRGVGKVMKVVVGQALRQRASVPTGGDLPPEVCIVRLVGGSDPKGFAPLRSPLRFPLPLLFRGLRASGAIVALGGASQKPLGSGWE